MRICHCQEDWQQEFAVDYLEDLVADRKHKLGYEQGILPQTSISNFLQSSTSFPWPKQVVVW